MAWLVRNKGPLGLLLILIIMVTVFFMGAPS